MKRFFLLALLSLTLGTSTAFAQGEPMYTGAGVVDMLKNVNEVVVVMTGYEHSYTAEWLQTMKLEDSNTVSFTRGRVKHSFDLRKIAMIQDEGRYIKLWIK
jgi:hypothetical protein